MDEQLARDVQAFMVLLGALLVFVVMIYTLIRLRANWNKQYMIKRHRWLTLISYVDVVCLGLMYLPIKTIEQWQNNPSLLVIPFFINTMLGSLMVMIAFAMVLLKIYLLYYDHQYSRMLSSNDWQILLNPDSENTNWFLTQKHKWGNEKYLLKKLLLPIFGSYAIIYIIVLSIMFSLNRSKGKSSYDDTQLSLTAYILLLVWFIVTLSLGITFWKQYPKFNDHLGIRNEIKLFIIMIVLMIVNSVIGLLLRSLVNPALDMMIEVNFEFIAVIILLILIIYPQKSNSLKAKQFQKQPVAIVQWRRIISTPNGYEQFALFLAKEFSTENLLFLTDYIQLKHEFLKVGELSCKMVDDLGLKYDLILPPNIPKPIIASQFENDFLNKFVYDGTENGTNYFLNALVFDAINKIYLKYIDPSKATLEVNISYAVKNKLMTMCNDISSEKTDKCIADILVALESAVSQVSFLLNDTQTRFKYQPGYLQLVQELN